MKNQYKIEPGPVTNQIFIQNEIKHNNIYYAIRFVTRSSNSTIINYHTIMAQLLK